MGKKKSAKRKGSSKKKKSTTPKDTADSSTKRQEQEMTVLRHTLAHRNNTARKQSFLAVESSAQLLEKDKLLDDESQDKMDIAADLMRQFKTMQSDMQSKIFELQSHTRKLETELEVTRNDLQDVKKKSMEMTQKKNEIIQNLRLKIDRMESSYENILNEAFDAMAAKVEQARDKWQLESYMVQRRNKDALLDFGLSHSVTI